MVCLRHAMAFEAVLLVGRKLVKLKSSGEVSELDLIAQV
jgi:hypothetical protein